MDDILGVSDSEVDLPSPVQEAEVSSQDTNGSEEQKAEGAAVSEEKPTDAASNFRALREQLSKLKSENETLSKAKELHNWIQSNELNKAIMSKLIGGQSIQDVLSEFGKGQEPEADPYDGYDPIVKKLGGELGELKKLFMSRQQQEQEAYKKQETFLIQQNMDNGNNHFDSLLDKGGFGNLPEESKEIIADATYKKLEKMLPDARAATQTDITEAFKLVTGGLKGLSKHSLERVSRTSIPPSGSAQGIVPGTTKSKGKEGRMEAIVNSLG